MKKNNYEEVLNAATRHLVNRNCTDSEVSKTKIKLKQSSEQFENSPSLGHKKIISLQNCNFDEHEADAQYSRLKIWIESLEPIHRLELEDVLFPTFVALYRKLNLSGHANSARNFYSQHQSSFFSIPDYCSMAERFCSESKSCFVLEISQESFDLLSKFIAKSDNPVLQHLFNTSLEVNIMNFKIEKNESHSEKIVSSTDIMNTAEELQDLMNAMKRLEELPPATPLLKLYTVDTGQRKMCTSSISSCQRYLCSGFQDSSVTIWDLNKNHSSVKPEGSSVDLACAIGLYHPRRSSSRSESEPASSGSEANICLGHSGPVYSVKFTPSNSHILSASEDTTIRLWDVTALENVVVYRGHTYPVWTLDTSPQGQYFASGSQDRTAKIWTFERTYPLRVFAGHTADVDSVTFHPNGLYVATGSADGTVRMWSVTDGKPVRILVGHRGTVLSIGFSPCGKLLASAGEDHCVKVWDVAAGSVLHDFGGHNDLIHSVVWLTDNLLASCNVDGSVKVWDLTQNYASYQSPHQLSSYSVPSPWKIVHLGRGHRTGLVCVASSD